MITYLSDHKLEIIEGTYSMEEVPYGIFIETVCEKYEEGTLKSHIKSKSHNSFMNVSLHAAMKSGLKESN